jgi:uroporphyrin-III C-methyltransferase/precorrin-2 dehydrogenase/sirohydrochlorin ferrochelatase
VAAVRDALDLMLASGQVDLRARRPAGGDRARGRVLLVGGGPGAPDLVTVRARQALAMADVVVTDRLGPTTLLDTLPADVEVIDVGKAPGHHPVPQEEINRLLVEHALRGRTVVRLKGGDPFLYGRGGEEQAACADHGVAVEVVPGVSSALAAPTMAGIPVTHRGVANAVHVEHGHGRLGPAAVGTVLSGTGTLVVLMGVGHLGRHSSQLLEAGADPTTPVAVVESASLPHERVTRATLAGIGAEAAAAGVRSPAVLVVGAVAAAGLLTGRT